MSDCHWHYLLPGISVPQLAAMLWALDDDGRHTREHERVGWIDGGWCVLAGGMEHDAVVIRFRSKLVKDKVVQADNHGHPLASVAS